MRQTGTSHADTRTAVEIFDTTLRDGLQVEGVSATVEDKLRIAEQLDYLGVDFIEGGWPGANPKDIEFFARAATELDLTTSTLVAFGSTRRPRGKVDDDPRCSTCSMPPRLPCASSGRAGTTTSSRRSRRPSTRARR
jgi:hypothetical protein